VRLAVEDRVVQDLMQRAIHVRDAKTFRACVGLLDAAFHAPHRKRVKGVDAMLRRLYGPILWRSLSVANPDVRLHAATLLVDAFPLQDPDAHVRAHAEGMQRQFDALQAMLKDTAPQVRVVGVKGICKVLNAFWSAVPAVTRQLLLSRLVAQMRRDAASVPVREAVFVGLAYLLDNHEAHALLKVLLPHAKDSLHDRSPRVRAAFVKMLLRVNGVRSIRFFDVSPVAHLLCRMRLDAARLACLLSPQQRAHTRTFLSIGRRSPAAFTRSHGLEFHSRACIRFCTSLPNGRTSRAWRARCASCCCPATTRRGPRARTSCAGRC